MPSSSAMMDIDMDANPDVDMEASGSRISKTCSHDVPLTGCPPSTGGEDTGPRRVRQDRVLSNET